jgi:hypothetical protein
VQPRQSEFRQGYRAQIARHYYGWVHVAMIFAIGAAVIAYALPHVRDPVWTDWLAIPLVFLLANLIEWALHRYVMHRPVKWAMGIYRRHTLAHHVFFTDDSPTFDTSRDFRIVFFPPYALVGFVLFASAGAALLAAAWSENAGWLTVVTAAAMYLNYETFHYCCHVKDDRIVRHIPLINTIRRHHIAHHDPALMMERNMNLTYPIADWLFGTSDLRRGLVGHLFNGYSTRHRRRELGPAG